MIQRNAVIAACAASLLLAGCAPEPSATRPVETSDLRTAGAGAPRLVSLELSALAGFTQSADPALAVDPATGELLVALLAEGEADGWDLWFTRIGADGADSLVRVNDVPGEPVPHAEGSPRLVAFPGGAALIWNNRIQEQQRRFNASDLRFARSVDGGRSWSRAVNLQDPVTPPGLPRRGNSFHGAAWDGADGLVVAWLDGRERDWRRVARGVAAGVPEVDARRTPEAFADEHDPHDDDATVFAALSPDLGASWMPANLRLEGRVCSCCRITLLTGADGTVYGTWREHFAGSVRDPVVKPLLRNGVPLEGVPLRVHEDDWVFPGCPHSGPGLALDAAGTLHVTWYTGAPGRIGTWYARKTADAASFGAPVPVVQGPQVGVAHPAIVARPDGSIVIAQNVAGDGRRAIVLSGLDPAGNPLWQVEAPDSEGSTHPQLALLADDRIVVAWTQSRRGVQSVRIAQLLPALQPPAAIPAPAAADQPSAPDWRASDLDGVPLALGDLRGEAVVLNIWATWCAPCLREMPKLQALQQDYAARGLHVLGVSIDRGSALPQVRAFVDELGIDFRILLDPDQQVMSAFGALGVPETFLIDRAGRIVHRWTGEFDPGDPAERALVEAVLR